MTLNELHSNIGIQTPIKGLSARSGKVLAYKFDTKNERHVNELGNSKILNIWAEIQLQKSSFGNYANPIICCYIPSER